MTDRKTILFVVISIAVLTATALVGAILLTIADKASDVVSGLAGTGLGALAAMLVSTRSSDPIPASGTTVQTVDSTTVSATDTKA